MEKKDYLVPVADIIELTADIVLLSDEDGWGDLIPFDSVKGKADETKSKW